MMHTCEPTNPSPFERRRGKVHIQFVHVFHIRFVCFPLSDVHHSWGWLWNNAALKITFQCPISCLSVRMKLPYKHHCASWLSELRSFVRDWAAKSILAFLCQQLCPCMMMSLVPVSACEGRCISTVSTSTLSSLCRKVWNDLLSNDDLVLHW